MDKMNVVNEMVSERIEFLNDKGKDELDDEEKRQLSLLKKLDGYRHKNLQVTWILYRLIRSPKGGEVYVIKKGEEHIINMDYDDIKNILKKNMTVTEEYLIEKYEKESE